jgi:hypothetical protein
MYCTRPLVVPTPTRDGSDDDHHALHEVGTPSIRHTAVNCWVVPAFPLPLVGVSVMVLTPGGGAATVTVTDAVVVPPDPVQDKV